MECSICHFIAIEEHPLGGWLYWGNTKLNSCPKESCFKEAMDRETKILVKKFDTRLPARSKSKTSKFTRLQIVDLVGAALGQYKHKKISIDDLLGVVRDMGIQYTLLTSEESLGG